MAAAKPVFLGLREPRRRIPVRHLLDLRERRGGGGLAVPAGIRRAGRGGVRRAPGGARGGLLPAGAGAPPAGAAGRHGGCRRRAQRLGDWLGSYRLVRRAGGACLAAVGLVGFRGGDAAVTAGADRLPGPAALPPARALRLSGADRRVSLHGGHAPLDLGVAGHPGARRTARGGAGAAGPGLDFRAGPVRARLAVAPRRHSRLQTRGGRRSRQPRLDGAAFLAAGGHPAELEHPLAQLLRRADPARRAGADGRFRPADRTDRRSHLSAEAPAPRLWVGPVVVGRDPVAVPAAQSGAFPVELPLAAAAAHRPRPGWCARLGGVVSRPPGSRASRTPFFLVVVGPANQRRALGDGNGRADLAGNGRGRHRQPRSPYAPSPGLALRVQPPVAGAGNRPASPDAAPALVAGGGGVGFALGHLPTPAHQSRRAEVRLRRLAVRGRPSLPGSSLPRPLPRTGTRRRGGRRAPGPRRGVAARQHEPFRRFAFHQRLHPYHGSWHRPGFKNEDAR